MLFIADLLLGVVKKVLSCCRVEGKSNFGVNPGMYICICIIMHLIQCGTKTKEQACNAKEGQAMYSHMRMSVNA